MKSRFFTLEEAVFVSIIYLFLELNISALLEYL